MRNAVAPVDAGSICEALERSKKKRRLRLPLYLKSLTWTISLIEVPRSQASVRPSFDQAKRKIQSVLKSVICRGGLPSIGWLQIFEIPSR